MKNLLRKINRRLANWLDDKKAIRESRKLRRKYEPLIADATKRKNANERERLLSEWFTQQDLWMHPVYARKADRLTAKARTLGITVANPVQPVGEADDPNWEMSLTTGDMMLTDEYEQKLRLEIRAIQREDNDERRKWATLIFAIVGTALAAVSVRSKQKQPDPCPRNYYRTDAGECVFALQKAQTPQPQSLPAQPAQTDCFSATATAGHSRKAKKPE